MEKKQKVVEILKSYGGIIKYRIYPDVEHDVCNKEYINKELYTWFLQHKRIKNKLKK